MGESGVFCGFAAKKNSKPLYREGMPPNNSYFPLNLYSGLF
jgi:hypothetical protein